jgi:hypothetical protein
MNLPSKATAIFMASISAAFLYSGSVAQADETGTRQIRPDIEPPIWDGRCDGRWGYRCPTDRLCTRFCRAEYLDCLGYERDRERGRGYTPYGGDYISGLESRCYRKYLHCRNECDIYPY